MTKKTLPVKPKAKPPVDRRANAAASHASIKIPQSPVSRGKSSPDPLKAQGEVSAVETWQKIWGSSQDDQWKVKFLTAFQKSKNLGQAIVVCGINRTTINRARKLDPRFEEALGELWENFIDDLEESALTRATEGTMRYNYDIEGNVVSAERKFETQLTIFMLQSNRRKYRIAVDGQTSLEDVVNKFHDITGRLKATIPSRDTPPSLN